MQEDEEKYENAKPPSDARLSIFMQVVTSRNVDLEMSISS